MINIPELFFQYLPYSLIVFVVPIGIWYMRTREKTAVIKNQVEVFFKGGTKEYYSCTVGKDSITFTIDETEYIEPKTHIPRIETKDKHLYRTYMFAEGIGLIEVPPLTHEDKVKIVKYLTDNKVIDEELQKKSIDDWTEVELMTYIRFYNFDIEHLLDKPMQKAFTSGSNAITAILDRISERNRSMEGLGKTSNLAKLAYVVIGVLIGAGFAWAFALKGYI